MSIWLPSVSLASMVYPQVWVRRCLHECLFRFYHIPSHAVWGPLLRVCSFSHLVADLCHVLCLTWLLRRPYLPQTFAVARVSWMGALDVLMFSLHFVSSAFVCRSLDARLFGLRILLFFQLSRLFYALSSTRVAQPQGSRLMKVSSVSIF